MKIASVCAMTLLMSSLLPIGACSSSQDKGLEGEGIGNADSAPDTNPDGIPYPKDNIGRIERKGTRLGNRIANFKFLGYPNADRSLGLQPMSLAQFYDPTGARYKVVHIQASGVWCSACQSETRVVVPMAADLERLKVVWIVSLAEGPTAGQPSKQKDLDGWIATFKSPFNHFLDPNNANLGPFYDRNALPWNTNIDARTMEILTAGTGGVGTRQGILDEIDEAMKLMGEAKLPDPAAAQPTATPP
jgi:hypothetical protein